MKTRKLNDSESWAVANALRVAAEQYDADADFHSEEKAAARNETEMPAAARASMVRQFQDQSKLVRKLAEEFEGAESVTVAG